MIYLLRKQCKLCFAIAEYKLLDMDLCEYDYIILSNSLFSRDGNDKIHELMRLLE